MADATPPRPSRRPAQPAGRPAARRRKPLIQVDPEANREPELSEQVVQEVKRDLPGLLISLAMHAAVLALLAIIPILMEQPPPVPLIELEWATAARPTPPPAPVRLNAPIALNRSTPPPSAPRLQPKAPEPAAPPAPPEVEPVAVSHPLGQRGAPDPDGLAARDAFHEDARKAIDRGLIWIVRQQQSDGHWSLDGPYSDGATRTRWSTDAGATGLALLALLGDGNTPAQGTHQEAVRKGLAWLVSIQRPTGEIYDGSEEGEEPSIYTHAIATIVLCEAITLTGDETLRPAAERAVKFLVRAQNPVQGGWRYRPLTESGEGDLSVTGWALMALHTARMAGIEVPPEAYLLASSFLDRCQEFPGDPSRYKYTPTYPPDPEQRISMTASGLLARQWLGWPREHVPLRKGTTFLLSDIAKPRWEEGKRNVYAWYYQAAMLHNLGGDPWREWFAELQEVIVRQQVQGGKEAGSWHPTRPPGSVHEWSAVVGRLYVTVMCVLILETPFRHAPLYETAD